ncbi:MAG: DUF3365 domain-containing protein [Planctomycetales bacterium]
MSIRTRSVCLGVATLLVLAAVAHNHLSATNKGEPSDPALERTRKQVRMLDDIYKSAVVLITEHYVHKDTDLPAGTAAKALFAAVKKKGWHEVRLVDATGDPIAQSNAPADDFERTAVKQLLDGKPGHEQVIEKEGKRYLRSATPIPVVMKKCVLCHPHYEEVKEGQPIGTLAYMLPIE